MSLDDYEELEETAHLLRSPKNARRLLAAMRVHPLGAQAAVIGQVVADPNAFVQIRTQFGGRRMVDWLSGEQLPRIC
jgi:hydrogenase expression/formation protein HypE